MNTLDDLDLALRDLEQYAPELNDVRRRLAGEIATPKRTLRRYALPAAAAVVIAAIAIATSVLTSGGGQHRPVHPGNSMPPQPSTSAVPSPTPTPTQVRTRGFDLTWDFSVHPVPGYTITRESIISNDQTARVTVRGAVKDIGSIDVYAPGYVPQELATLSRGAQTTVSGRPGYFAVTGDRSATIWEYADGAWAEVSGDWGYSAPGVDANVARAGELRIAEAVDTTTTDPLRVDFTLGYLPRQLQLGGTILYANPYGTGPQCELDFVDGIAGQASGAGNIPAVTITRLGMQPDTARPGDTGFVPNMTVRGRPAEFSQGFLAIRYPDNTELTIAVDANHYARYPKTELVKIAEHAAPAGNPRNINTWTTGTTAVPQ